MKPIKPMLPTLVHDLPEGDGWHYEVKYDGYRALLHIDKDHILFHSRNLKPLSSSFPEIIAEAENLQQKAGRSLPIIFDGELCILQSKWKAGFSDIQKRGRLKNSSKIERMQSERPATFLIFDMLMEQGEPLFNQTYTSRRQSLIDWTKEYEVPQVKDDTGKSIQRVDHFEDGKHLFETVKQHNGEGIIAKKTNSTWMAGKRSSGWLKVKNFALGNFIVSGYDFENGFVHVVVVRNGSFYDVGLFSHGLEGTDREALIEIIKTNQVGKTGNLVKVKPGICVELEFLELYEEQLRQPRFVRFRLDLHWEECTWEALQKQMDN